MIKWRPLSVLFAVAGMASALTAQVANAQTWPTRPVSLVVPFAAGSASDTVARILGTRLSEILGQQVLVENIGGAGGMTGAARVAKATPDGYQFVLGGVDTFAMNQTLYKKPLYDASADFAPVALMVEQALILVARNDLPAGNLQEFIAHAKANQAKMQYGSAGVGSGSHLACARLNSAIGVDVTHVPYRGSPPAMQDLIAGRIDYFCALAAAAMPQLTGNSMKAIAIMTRERSPLLANLASVHEQGVADFDANFWSGFLPAPGHAGRDRSAPQRRRRRNPEHALRAGAAQRRRRDRRSSRSPVAGISQGVRRERDPEMGGHHQSERRQPRLMDCFGPWLTRSQHHHGRADLHPAVEIDHILIGYPDAA